MMKPPDGDRIFEVAVREHTIKLQAHELFIPVPLTLCPLTLCPLTL